MTKPKILVAILLLLSLPCSIQAQKENQKERPPEKRIYAQKLVDNLFQKRHDLISLGLHLTPPGGSDNVIVASNVKSKIGKKSDGPDMLVMTSGNPLVKTKPENVYDIVLPLYERSGKTIGIVGMNLRCKGGESSASALHRARGIAAKLKRQIPSAAALFEEAS